jgi:peptidyl-prolyl cis-trans isomerase D
MEVGTISWSEDVSEGIAAYESFRTAAAAAEQGTFPKLEDLSDGGIFAMRLDAVVPPAVPPLDEIRDEVGAAWQAQARQDAIMAKATEISASILPLTGFETLGLTAKVEENLTRRSFVEGTPPDFNSSVFDMAIGETRVIDAADVAIIVRLDNIAPPDLTDPSTLAQQESLAQNAAAGIAQDIFDAYATTLQQITDININQATVNAVNAQFQ